MTINVSKYTGVALIYIYSNNGNIVFSEAKNIIEKKITPKDPRIAYYIWGNSEYTFDKARPYIMGVKEYGSQKSKTVRFSQSFGLNYTGGLITPFLPDKFSIKNIDCFGAVKYNGNWKGVRFVGDKHVW